jgi:hypothetical protein
MGTTHLEHGIFGSARRDFALEFYSCLNLILACIVYWQGRGNLPGPQPVRPGRQWNRSLPARTRQPPIEWDYVVLYGQYILDRKLVASAVAQKESALAYKLTRISLVPFLLFSVTIVWS